jgi:ribosomal protein S1
LSDILGDEVKVKVIGFDRGKVKLSIKQVEVET